MHSVGSLHSSGSGSGELPGGLYFRIEFPERDRFQQEWMCR